MKRLLLPNVLTAIVILGTHCGSDSVSQTPDLMAGGSMDAGARLDTRADVAPAVDAERPDLTPSPSDAPTDAAPATHTPPASPDASNLNVIYATWNGTLVLIDPDTAKATDIGVLKDPGNPAQTFVDVTMTWFGSGDTALASLGYLMPRLATINLCTALVTPGAAFSRAATPNLVVEGLARHPDGTWYVSSGNSTITLSPNLGKLDITTGVITNLGGAVTTLQNDIDQLFFKDTTLFGLDVSTDVNRIEIYTLDLATGVDANNVISMQTDEPLRLAYDASRGKTFSWRQGDRQLLDLNLATGAVTPIGETHPATKYGNAAIRGFFIAPAPRCP